MKNTADETTKKLFDIVQQKKKEIEKISRPNWLTNCSYPIRDTKINIHTVNDVTTLVELLANLNMSNNTYIDAATELGVNSTYKLGGFTADEWKTDIKTRLAKIQIKTKEDELSNLEKRLDLLVSPEMKRQLEIEEISKLLEDGK